MASLPGGKSGLFVLLTLAWYFIFPNMVTCNEAEFTDCEEIFNPILAFFCATPPLIIAVLLYISANGERPKVGLENPKVSEGGAMAVSNVATHHTQRIKHIELAGTAMTIGGITFTLAYGLMLLIGILFGLMAGMCAFGGCNGLFETTVDWLSYADMVMKIGMVVFFISAITKLVLEFNLEKADGTEKMHRPQEERTDKVTTPCPSCGKKLRFPAAYSGEVQCPSCQHIFETGKG